jgi:hypothetical protein
MNAEIAAANAQQRSGRRRREKKLMTMDDVNAQFPLQSYKAWRANRERAGLSTEGGMQAVDPETAQVARQEMQQEKAILTTDEMTDVELPTGAQLASEQQQLETSKARKSMQRGDTYAGDTIYEVGSSQIPTGAASSNDKADKHIDVDEADIAEAGIAGTSTQADSVSPAPGPAAAEIVAGDTCAICIDTLEDDDDIRGLTCGHAFHAACVDQWLTTRRAICPLCKKDFWVRKTPTTGEGHEDRSEEEPLRGGLVGAIQSLNTIRMPRFGRRARQDESDRRTQRQGDLEQGSEMSHLPSRPRSRDVTEAAGRVRETTLNPYAMASIHAAQR